MYYEDDMYIGEVRKAIIEEQKSMKIEKPKHKTDIKVVAPVEPQPVVQEVVEVEKPAVVDTPAVEESVAEVAPVKKGRKKKTAE